MRKGLFVWLLFGYLIAVYETIFKTVAVSFVMIVWVRTSQRVGRYGSVMLRYPWGREFLVTSSLTGGAGVRVAGVRDSLTAVIV